MAQAKKKVLATVSVRLDFQKEKARAKVNITHKNQEFYESKLADKILNQVMPGLSEALYAAEQHDRIDSKSIRISFNIIEK